MTVYGILNLPWWGYIVALMIMTQITIMGVTIYLHRCQAHRALDLHPIVSHFFRFWLWLTTGMVTKHWAAIHRKHHAKVETPYDPHSPIEKGIKTVFFKGAELYREEAKNQETIERYGEGTPDDWIERHLYSPYSVYGVVTMLIIDLLLFGVLGITMWALQMAWIPLFAAGVVNGIGHYWGYRNYESKDASRNIFPLGLFIGGEELHNNHHAFATSAKFSARWFEFDLGWCVIRLLQFFGLATPKRVLLARPKCLPEKTWIDADTLKAVISYRMQVMARYTSDVMVPLLRHERKAASAAGRALLHRAKAILSGEASFLSAAQQQRLASLLEQFQSLRIVYQYRTRLQDIWNRRTATQKELLEALQEWCQQAEATGIEVLSRFAKHIKTYVPQEA